MQLNVTGHHVDVTSSLKGYVEKKLDRIVRHSDQVIDVHCILTVEKLRHKAEATVLLSGATVYADATDRTCTPPSTRSPTNSTGASRSTRKSSPTTTRSRRRRTAAVLMDVTRSDSGQLTDPPPSS